MFAYSNVLKINRLVFLQIKMYVEFVTGCRKTGCVVCCLKNVVERCGILSRGVDGSKAR